MLKWSNKDVKELDRLVEDLIKARQRLGISQADLAGRLGVSTVGISSLEQRVRSPSVEMLLRVAEELGLKITLKKA